MNDYKFYHNSYKFTKYDAKFLETAHKYNTFSHCF